MLHGSAFDLLAFADRIPNQEAIARSPIAGWILFFSAACLALILMLNREGFRRLWMRLEDPRPMAVFRIGFGLCAMANVNGLWEHFRYLFTDEGIFLTDVARQVFAREQFQGFGNGLSDDPYGFFGLAGFFQWLKGPKYSTLFFWDTPAAFWIQWGIFQASITLMVIGLWTKYTKWIAWFLFHAIILRNNLFWEGTENVYRTFFFYLVVSRCGAAYSVDNWLRCRKLRKQGLLDDRDGPGRGAGVAPNHEHPRGLEPIFRPIASWPRLLVILQIATIYLYTGVVKNGPVWLSGDAFYYALNLDHFYRLPPQYLSSILGTNLFRINTHVTHWWEVFFHLIVLGLVARWAMRVKLPPLPRAHRIAVRAAWVGLGLGILALVLYLYPVHYAPARGSWLTTRRAQMIVGASWLLGMGLLGYLYYRLRYKPFRVEIGSRQWVFDLEAALTWLLGRRLWLSLGVIFHGHLILLMNIGWFSPGVLSGYACFLNGTEISFLGLLIGRRLARIGFPGIPAWIKRGEQPTPPADLTLPGYRRDGIRLPLSSLLLTIPLVVLGIVLQVEDVLPFGWSLLGIAAFLAGSLARQMLGDRPPDYTIVPPPPRRNAWTEAPDRSRTLATPWAYGPLGRFIATSVVVYHVIGVAVWLIPDKDSFSTWRTHTHTPFKWWLQVTQTSQGWKMFAPNPPRSNLFMRVLVTDSKGEVWDLNTDVYKEGIKPVPWIFYSRTGKMNRRIVGGEGGHGSWYQKWHARYLCRQWTLDHDGEVPATVELIKVTYPIPTPEWLAKHGPYEPLERLARFGKQTSVYKVRCATEMGAQVPNVIRRRYGLPPVDNVRRWNALRNKKSIWDRKLERDRKPSAN